RPNATIRGQVLPFALRIGAGRGGGKTQDLTPFPRPHGITRSHPDAAYTVNADGTITDTRTGLTWDRCAWG
ncbi:MAG: DUF1566 domain-containing protein, partial [Gammaproteobacteria bacterium]|nr:DUF1566 domain-containing protein [Gammaproteobacteria bacterium]